MNPMMRSLLIATNGTENCQGAVDYGIWLAELLHLPVSLLGIIEDARRKSAVQEIIEQACQKLAVKNLACETRLVTGDPIPVIIAEANPQVHLLVLGRMGRPQWLRWLRGRSFRYILQDIQAPLIYVPEYRPRLQRILLCAGGLEYTRSVEQWAIFLAHTSQVEMTILHVVEPLYYEYPVTDKLQTHWTNVLETDTPQGRNLRLALQTAQDAGLSCEVKIRHGDVIHEIEAEIRTQDYDLVAMGAAGSSHSLRRLYMPNVTAEVAEISRIPVLTARLNQEVIFDTALKSTP
jgi:nucleotide-binding universal stress UspA family protein